MARIPRLVIPGTPHHISQRGNNKQDVFFNSAERETYLIMLKRFSTKHRLDILAYCLMTNHIHIIAIPAGKESMAKTIGQTHMAYAQMINSIYQRCGHLWHERFHSSPFDFDFAIALFRYVELNPVRAGIVSDAWHYPWSSANAHITGQDPKGILNMEWWLERFECPFWKRQLNDHFESSVDYIRVRTKACREIGNPLGGGTGVLSQTHSIHLSPKSPKRGI